MEGIRNFQGLKSHKSKCILGFNAYYLTIHNNQKIYYKESAKIIQRILSLALRIEELNFFHILCHLNSKVHKLSKKGAIISQDGIEYNM